MKITTENIQNIINIYFAYIKRHFDYHNPLNLCYWQITLTAFYMCVQILFRQIKRLINCVFIEAIDWNWMNFFVECLVWEWATHMLCAFSWKFEVTRDDRTGWRKCYNFPENWQTFCLVSLTQLIGKEFFLLWKVILIIWLKMKY